MHCWTMNNNYMTGRLFSGPIYGLLMIVFVSVTAGDAVADRLASQYRVQQVSEQSNPWQLPQKQQNQNGLQPGSQQAPYGNYQQYQAQPQQNRNSGRQSQSLHQWQPQADRFVSPEFLDSLKQQQRHYQVSPESQRYHQPRPPQFMQVPPGAGTPGYGLPGSGAYGSGAYSYPKYGAGSANPLYDTPAVSPWGSGPDVLYRGESFPMIPNEALGGFPPMHVPSFGMNNYKKDEAGDLFETDDSGVFNPFTFLPNGVSR